MTEWGRAGTTEWGSGDDWNGVAEATVWGRRG